MSALLVAPVAGLVTKEITGSGKFGALSALGVIGGSSILEFMEATKDQRKTYDRYKNRGGSCGKWQRTISPWYPWHEVGRT